MSNVLLGRFSKGELVLGRFFLFVAIARTDYIECLYTDNQETELGRAANVEIRATFPDTPGQEPTTEVYASEQYRMPAPEIIAELRQDALRRVAALLGS